MNDKFEAATGAILARLKCNENDSGSSDEELNAN